MELGELLISYKKIETQGAQSNYAEVRKESLSVHGDFFATLAVKHK